MAKGHRSQVKKARNEQNKDRRPQAHVKFVEFLIQRLESF